MYICIFFGGGRHKTHIDRTVHDGGNGHLRYADDATRVCDGDLMRRLIRTDQCAEQSWQSALVITVPASSSILSNFTSAFEASDRR